MADDVDWANIASGVAQELGVDSVAGVAAPPATEPSASPSATPGDGNPPVDGGAAADSSSASADASAVAAGGATDGQDAGDPLLSYVKGELGFDPGDKYRDGRALLEGLISAQKRLSQRDDEAAAWRAFQQNPQPILSQYMPPPAQPVVQQPAPPVQTPPPAQAEPPEYDESWELLVRRDENGNLVSIPGAPPDLPAKLKAAHDHIHKEAIRLFLKKPDSQEADRVRRLEEQVAAMWEEKQLHEAIANKAGRVEKAQNIIDAYKTILYDANGQPSEVSKFVVAQALAMQKQYGIDDPVVQLEYALGQLALKQQSQPRVVPPPPPPVSSSFRPNVASPPPATASGDAIRPGESLEDALQRRFSEAGISLDAVYRARQ